MKVSIKLPSGKFTVNHYQAKSITIGRSNKCDFVVADESMSRSHAQIEVSNGDFFITDLGSSNGVFIDGKRIPGHSKTKFNSFQQILIASLECQIEDTSDHNEANTVEINSRSEPKQDYISDNTATAKLIRPTPPVTSSHRKSSAASSKSTSVSTKKKIDTKILPVIVLIIGGMIFFYFNSSDDQNIEGKSNDEQLVLSNVPIAFRDVKDEFDKDYIVIYANNGCDKEARLCNEMNLSTQNGEGIVREDKNIFIFINPSAHLENKFFSRIKELSDSTDLISLYLLLNSSIMKDFDKKSVGQVHLVVLDKAFKEIKAFRFHPKYFAGNEVTRMLSELGDVIDGGAKTEIFWNYANPLIKTKNL